MAYRVAIIGSRSFPLPALIYRVMEALPKDVVIVSGRARGADTFAEEIAPQLGLEFDPSAADWNGLGGIAGPARNNAIIDSVHEVIAFYDGTSPGTLDAITRARARGIPVTIYGATGMRATPRADDVPSRFLLPV